MSGFFDALSEGRAVCRRALIIDMFAVRKSDKQVRDKEGIPRISGQDSEGQVNTRGAHEGAQRDR